MYFKHFEKLLAFIFIYLKIKVRFVLLYVYCGCVRKKWQNARSTAMTNIQYTMYMYCICIYQCLVACLKVHVDARGLTFHL